MAWNGICYDDGTGRNVYYVEPDGERKRKQPDNYVPEVFSDGSRKFYYRGTCIRCKIEAPAVFMVKQPGYMGYSFNMCSDCLVATIDGDFSKGLRALRGRGNDVWNANFDAPKHFLRDLEIHACDPDREQILINRASESQFHVRTQAKQRRNADRSELIKTRAMEYHIFKGKHLSWGFDEQFDEYFGEVDDTGKLPHGHGVMWYSDGSTYVGGWQDGLKHTTGKGRWERPDSSMYEGQWLQGLKHGTGQQIYPDGCRYTGQYAKGYEHGQGVKYEQDDFIFEGRFRFGKKDGPGVLTSPEGQQERRIFKDTYVFHEKPVPEIVEAGGADRKYFEPETLMQLCLNAVGKTMHQHRTMVPSQLLHRRLPEFMKPWAAQKYLTTIFPRGTVDFVQAAPTIAFKSVEEVNMKAVKFAHFDCESLLYFTAANTMLKSLQITLNRLDPASIDLINKKLITRTWPLLETFDLSFNRLDVTLVRNMSVALSNNPNLKYLKLSGCHINPTGAEIIAEYLGKNSTILEIDLSFNSLQVAGAEAFGKALRVNKTLVRANLRQNGVGSVGGGALAEAMKFNHTLRELCLVDNKVGIDVINLITARLYGSVAEAMLGVRTGELVVPNRHADVKYEPKRKPVSTAF